MGFAVSGHVGKPARRAKVLTPWWALCHVAKHLGLSAKKTEMKKSLAIGIISALAILPTFAAAQTAPATNNSALIAVLEQLVQLLTQEINQILAQQSQQVLTQQQQILNSPTFSGATSSESGTSGVEQQTPAVSTTTPAQISSSYTEQQLNNGNYGISFNIEVQNALGNDIVNPDVVITSELNGQPFSRQDLSGASFSSTEDTSDPSYPWSGGTIEAGHWYQNFSPTLNQAGTYTFTFTSGSVSTSTQIVIQ